MAFGLSEHAQHQPTTMPYLPHCCHHYHCPPPWPLQASPIARHPTALCRSLLTTWTWSCPAAASACATSVSLRLPLPTANRQPQANLLVTSAYQFTSLTSITLLDCFTVPAVMALSLLVLRARYRLGHMAGAALCVLGLTVLVLGDASASGADAGSRPLLGDALVVAGAVLYAMCNVSQVRLRLRLCCLSIQNAVNTPHLRTRGFGQNIQLAVRPPTDPTTRLLPLTRFNSWLRSAYLSLPFLLRSQCRPRR